jgi:glutamate-1-semialdehyde 2,1-aminomutase
MKVVAKLKTEKSKQLFAEANAIFPGGVNSPVRAFSSVGGNPVFVSKGAGPYIYDEDGNRYIDYVGSWGPLIVGHAHPEVVQAVCDTAQRGFSFGAPTKMENQLGRKIMQLMPSMEMIRFVSSGTEACMSALRLARAYTGREKILKFDGCYHGHADMLLVKAGSGLATFAIPGSPGVPEATAAQTLVATFNDSEEVRRLFEREGREIAAIIVEPIVGNSGFIRPRPGFLQELRRICDEYGAVLIFDEVMTGFRVALGGAQQLYGIKPDLTTLGKVIGGGMPIAAYGGAQKIMQMVAPSGPVYQAGTLSGNPLATASGLRTLELISQHYQFADLERNTRQLIEGMSAAAKKVGIPFMGDCQGGMFGFFFAKQPVANFSEAKKSNQQAFTRFFWEMLARGIYLAPSAYEAGFVSFTHTPEHIEQTISAATDAFIRIKEEI